jgi:hypothetical protein
MIISSRNAAYPLIGSVLLAAALAAPAPAAEIDGGNLRLLLLGMQDMNTPQTVMRADIDGAIDVAGKTNKLQAVAVYAPGKDARWYIQIREPAVRALVLGSDRKVMQQIGSKTETVPIGAPIDGLGISYEDLSRFIADDFKTQQITDESADTVLVGMHPAVESAYVYRAYLIDKEKKVPTRTQYYAKTLNNLIKLRLDTDYVLIGKKWWPGTIEIQNYPENVTVKLPLRWSQNTTIPPELLAPASFAAAPPLSWTAPAGAGATQSGAAAGAATSPKPAATGP